MRRLLVVYHHFPAYRRAVLQQLCASELLDVTLASDTSIKSGKLSVLNEDQLIEITGKPERFLKLHNISILGHVFGQIGLVSHLLRTNYDVVVLLGDYKILSYYICLLICRFRGMKTLLWTHGLLKPDRKSFNKFIRELFYQLSDGFLLYGYRAVELLKGTLRKDLHYTVIGNSVDYTAIARHVQIDSNLRSLNKLVYIGRVNQDKKLELLLDALQLTNTELNLEIIGSGDALAALKKKAIDLKRGNVTFHGEMDNEVDIASIMNASSVAVIPGDIGLSAIHSLSYGLSVVTHDKFELHKPEVEALTESETGYYYKYDDVSDLANKIDRALSSAPNDRHKCVQTIERSFTPESQVLRIESAITQLMNLK